MGSYIPNTGKEQLEMLKSMGYSSMDDLFAAIPDDMKLKDGLDLPEGKSELEVSRIMKGIAAKNRVFSSIFRGAGAYNHYTEKPGEDRHNRPCLPFRGHQGNR